MTCLQYKALLDDYADKELSSDKAAELEKHLKECSDCQKELEEIISLKELLYLSKSPLPNQEYFEETDTLIFAKTIDASKGFENVPIASQQKVKTDFFRAIMSAAAALIILAVSIVIGTSQSSQITEINNTQTQVFVIHPLDEMNDATNSIILTKAEQINQIRGMLMLGPPGTLGRISAMYNFNRLQIK
ncbi:MAG: zf-HC2 domain-containing protein [Calditrichaeota bacterium]|nr:MAG: zf-HC2 domain-containing protein [Calditrichota bacterium]